MSTTSSKTKEAGTVEVKAVPESDPALAVPTVGRIVHMFKGTTDTPLAAIVTEVGLSDDPHTATLTVLERRGPRVMHEVEFSAEPSAGKWSWPARG